MIVLVWSLVSSAIDFNRKRRLRSALQQFFSDPQNKRYMLVCRRISAAAASHLSNGSSSLTVPKQNGNKYSSEPCLNQHCPSNVLYASEHAEVVILPAKALSSDDWKFCGVPCTSEESVPSISFVTHSGTIEDRRVGDGPSPICLNSSCERVAWNRNQPWKGIFSCSFDTFSDVVFAFTEGALLEHPYSPPLNSLHTVWLESMGDPCTVSSRRTSSMLSLLTNQKALPILEQLFFGDTDPLASIRQRFVSEGALNIATDFALSHRSYFGGQFSPHRRKRTTSTRSSLRYRASSPLAIEHKQSRELGLGPSCLSPPLLSGDYRSLPSSYRHQSLPPYLRQLDRESRKKNHLHKVDSEVQTDDGSIRRDCGERASSTERSQTSQLSATSSNTQSSTTVSPSVTAEDLHSEHSLVDDRIEEEEGYSESGSIALIDSESILCLMSAAVANGGDQCRNGRRNSRLTSGTMTSRSVGAETYVPSTTPLNTPRAQTPTTGRRPRSRSPLLEMFRRISVAVDMDSPRIVDPQLQKLTTFELLQRRRHSYIPQTSDDQDYGCRRRSLSPMTAEKIAIPEKRSITSRILGYSTGEVFKGSSIFGGIRDSFAKQVFTPVRRRSATRERAKDRVMKPPTILVYTGGQDPLYQRVRDTLTTVLPSNLYTVFHISTEAIRKQPWIEPSSACLLLADTTGLDDAAWSKMHTYFNHSGKIIFVCENKLLSSLTSADSAKKQANLLKMAFGERSAALGKEFESFLKKSLKTIRKKEQIQETFHSKDFIGGAEYTVVIAKKADTPLLLYMENKKHQASAIFSDATTEQMFVPGSKVVRDALTRVGIQVANEGSTIPSLTIGYLQTKQQHILDSMQGVRYGERISCEPSLFLRKSELLKENPLPSPSKELLPIEVKRSDDDLPSFDSSLYFSSLRTSRLGRVLVHVPVATSTMDICKSLTDAIPGCEGVVVVARQQTNGRGRGGNEFVSPAGAAMFTLNCHLPNGSKLHGTPSFVQHVLATSVAEAVQSISGMQDFPFRIKWPNDFYFNRTNKVGGLIASAINRDDCMEIILGVGLNVCNSQPTICLNDMLPEDSPTSFTVEKVIAEVINHFEANLFFYEMKGHEEFLKKYYAHWLHNREEVMLETNGEKEKVVVRGLDKWGFLQVRSRKNPQKVFSVGDDGNTFDMMKGLIRHKLT